jgi:hypothetical protein
MKRVSVPVAIVLRALSRACAIALLLVTLTPVYAEETSIKDDAKQAGKSVSSAVREVGQSAKKAGKEIGPATKQAGRAITQAAKNGVEALKQGGKSVKHAFVGEPKPKSAE